MGTIRKVSVLGRISGKIENIVVTKWKTQDVVKSTPSVRRKRKKLSAEKAESEHSFKVVQEFLYGIDTDVINTGYQLRKKDRMTAMNAATSYHLLNAVTGKYPDCSIDLTKVKFSRPLRSTENGYNVSFAASADGGFIINWELNPFPEKSTQLDDEAVIVFYDKKIEQFFTAERVQRNSLTCKFNVIRQLTGNDFACWIFFVSADGKLVSETEYLGTLTVKDKKTGLLT
jgi:hypothetical protein